jgi:hypothetical protein
MKFFTETVVPDLPWKIDYSKKMIFIGSCFAENIGQKLLNLKFKLDLNPFGVLYNPVSIANNLKILIEKRQFTIDDLFFEQGVWNSFSHHSRFSEIDADLALQKINDQIKFSHEFLRSVDFLMITFGTSWVYELKMTGQIVSNCHKLPAKEFKRYRLGVHEIIETYRELLQELWNFNPGLKIIFTVSPIRHLKDGAFENQLSKATLLLAIDRLLNGFGLKSCSYFPAYELMMDELRDYRFYAEDMVHPNQVAIDHIFERFCKAAVSPESNEIMRKTLKIRKTLMHRPGNTHSLPYLQLLGTTLDEINQLTTSFPNLDFQNEVETIKQKLQD